MRSKAPPWPVIVGATPPFADNPDRACVGIPTDEFYLTHPADQAAKRICRGCPLKADCLQWAIDAEEVGVWGGTTERDRERLTGRQARRPVPVRADQRRDTVALLVARGLTGREIAQQLNVNQRTVERDQAYLRQRKAAA